MDQLKFGQFCSVNGNGYRHSQILIRGSVKRLVAAGAAHATVHEYMAIWHLDWEPTILIVLRFDSLTINFTSFSGMNEFQSPVIRDLADP
mgnify:CR=1 FL=1